MRHLRLGDGRAEIQAGLTMSIRSHQAVVVPAGQQIGVLDGLVARVLSTYPYRFTCAVTPQERAVAYGIRWDAAIRAGWIPREDSGPAGQEFDSYDLAAVQVIGWDDDRAISTGRLVLPPNRLPTQEECSIIVEPPGRVVDVGRMCVASAYQSHRHAAFIALLSRLYLEMRERGYATACGMMSPAVRRLMRQLGLQLEELGDDRTYWGEQRAPVRFSLLANVAPLGERWNDEPDAG